MAFACDSSGRLYSFGGREEGGSNRLINSLFCLDTNSSTCRKITATDAPSPREESTMVYFNRQLIVHGGYTDDRASSDLLVFHLDNSEDCKVVCHVFLSPVDLERGLVCLYVLSVLDHSLIYIMTDV